MCPERVPGLHYLEKRKNIRVGGPLAILTFVNPTKPMNPLPEKKDIVCMQNCAYNVRALTGACDGSPWPSCEKRRQLWPGPHPIPVCERCRLTPFGQDPVRGPGAPQDRCGTFPQQFLSSLLPSSGMSGPRRSRMPACGKGVHLTLPP